jgi:hypothetical protein
LGKGTSTIEVIPSGKPAMPLIDKLQFVNENHKDPGAFGE